MRLSWGTCAALVALGFAGCHQLPRGKSAQELRPQEQKSGPSPQPLTATEIFQNAMAQADELRRQNNLPEAIALCEKMREPGSPYAWHATWKIAQLCEDDNEHLHRAEDEYRRLLAHNPGNADLIAKLGDIWARRGQWSAAEMEYSKALKYQPAHAGARSGLAFALAKGPDWARSIQEYSLLLPPADAYCAVGSILQRDGKNQEAQWCYQEALRREPNSFQARQGKAAMDQILAANPPTATAITWSTTEPKGQKGAVDLEEAPTMVIEGNSRTASAQPTLFALPPLEMPAENEREWKVSGKRP